MHAGLIECSLEHLASPTRFRPRRKIHELPHLGEVESTGLTARNRVTDRAKHGHLPKIVVQRHAAARDARGRDDAVGLGDARHERLLADHVRTGRDRPQAIILVGARRRADDHHLRFALREHGVEGVEHRHAEFLGSARPAGRIRVDCADDLVIGHSREGGKV